MKAWNPRPTARQLTASRRSSRIAFFFAFAAAIAGGGLFAIEGWPEWMGYLGGACGMVGWFFFVRSRQELGPPGDGPFGGKN